MTAALAVQGCVHPGEGHIVVGDALALASWGPLELKCILTL